MPMKIVKLTPKQHEYVVAVLEEKHGDMLAEDKTFLAGCVEQILEVFETAEDAP